MEMNKEEIEILERLEESLWVSETRFNLEYMKQILSPDFFEFGKSGRVYSREETLTAPAQEIEARLPLKEFSVHQVARDAILTTYVSEVKVARRPQVANRSSIWVKTGNMWKLRFHQGTPVAG